jgi:hypothetical protein
LKKKLEIRAVMDGRETKKRREKKRFLGLFLSLKE